MVGVCATPLTNLVTVTGDEYMMFFQGPKPRLVLVGPGCCGSVEGMVSKQHYLAALKIISH
jgi:hypothetical protein